MLGPLVSFMGAVRAPVAYISRKLGRSPPNAGWENLKVSYCRRFEFGIEVRNEGVASLTRETVESRVRQAVAMAVEKCGDTVIEPDVLVKESPLDDISAAAAGYRIDLLSDRDFTKHVLLDFILDRQASAYRILAAVYDHVIDGVPAALLVNLVHNHVMMGDSSYLSGTSRCPEFSYQDIADRFNKRPDRSAWLSIGEASEETLWPVGGHIDVSKSSIVRLRSKLKKEKGINASVSSIEIALIALDMSMRYVTDYVARGQANEAGQLDVSRGYDGLGMVRSRNYDKLAGLPVDEQYQRICDVLAASAEAVRQERVKKGEASLFYERYSRLNRRVVREFEKRVSYDEIMGVANTQLIGSNLNGVDFKVPVVVGPLRDGDIKYLFTASHGDFEPAIREERRKRGLATHLTEVSLACGPRTVTEDGRHVIYKSLKTSRRKALALLKGWGHDVEQFCGQPTDAVLKYLYDVVYSPKDPQAGRIEALAARFLLC